MGGRAVLRAQSRVGAFPFLPMTSPSSLPLLMVFRPGLDPNMSVKIIGLRRLWLVEERMAKKSDFQVWLGRILERRFSLKLRGPPQG